MTFRGKLLGGKMTELSEGYRASLGSPRASEGRRWRVEEAAIVCEGKAIHVGEVSDWSGDEERENTVVRTLHQKTSRRSCTHDELYPSNVNAVQPDRKMDMKAKNASSIYAVVGVEDGEEEESGTKGRAHLCELFVHLPAAPNPRHTAVCSMNGEMISCMEQRALPSGE